MFCVYCGLNEQAWELRSCTSPHGHSYQEYSESPALSYGRAVDLVRGHGYVIVMPANTEQATMGFSHIAAFRLGNCRVGPGFALTSQEADALFAEGTIHSANSKRTVLRM